MDERRIDVLDHGYVRLVDSMGSDLSVVRAARNSFDASWRAGKDEGKDERLLEYLLAHQHTSPFEFVEFTFDIKCPLFVARQWHRHRTWSYSEISARYTELPEEFYLPVAGEIGVQSADNKQARTLEDNAAAEEFRLALYKHSRDAFERYHDALEKGIPRELARCLLPMNTYTRFFAKTDLHNLMHFLRLRIHKHAQYEIRVYAEAILTLIRPVVPTISKLFERTL